MMLARFALPLLFAYSVAAQETPAADTSDASRVPLRERLRLSGTAELAAGIETRDGDLQKLQLRVQPQIDVSLADTLNLTVIPLLRADPADELTPGQHRQSEIGGATRVLHVGDSVELELREAYLQGRAGESYFTIGKQQIVWGEADGLKVLDIVNPQDFREFVLDDFDRSRIPQWSVNWEVPVKNATVQFVWIPDLTYHKIPEPGSTYEFVSNVPQAPPGFDVFVDHFDRPNNPLTDSDAGVRVSTFTGGWDLTFSYLYQYDNIPVLYRTVDLTLPTPTVFVEPSYERTHVLGTTFSNAFGDFTLRGEVGFFFDKYYSTTSGADVDGVHETNELSYVIGLDYFGFTDTLLSAQFFQSVLTDDAPGLLRDQVDNNVTFLARRSFRNNTLLLSSIWVHSLNDGDGFVRPKIEYVLRDNLDVWVGFDVFYGSRNGLFGQFTETDRFVAGMKWGF
jgi:hypothetical protein